MSPPTGPVETLACPRDRAAAAWWASRVIWRSWLERGLIAAALVTVISFYHWTVTTNNGFGDWEDLDYYRLLVRGWRKGHLYVDKAPSPELLALADPYDPSQNGPHRLGDASYFRGHYYLYFGAAPALTLMLPFNLITGRELTMGAAVFVFCSAGFLTAAGLWLAIRRRYFPESRLLIAPLGVLALGFGTHLLALAQRPMFWELPIAAAIAFSMLALAAVYRALHGRRPVVAMAVAGLCVGLAVASRPTSLFAAPLLVAPVWWAWWQRGTAESRASWLQLAMAAALPLGACGLAMMAHNYARFENVFEFGQSYQLSGAYEGQLQHFSLRFLPHNLAVYFFQPLGWTWAFPFVFAQRLPADITGYFGTEEVSGLAVTFPFLWFALGLPLMWWRRAADDRHQLTAIIGAVAGYALPVMLLLLCYFSTTMRYEADFAPALGLLALCGLLAIERRVRGPTEIERNSSAPPARPRVRAAVGTVATVATVTCLITVVMGVLVSFDYHGRSLRRDDPKLWHRLDRSSHTVLAEAGRSLGYFDGPRVLKVRFQPRPPGTIETFWRAHDARAHERIVLDHVGDQLIRFGYQRGSTPPLWGGLLSWKTDHTHTVSVQLPSLYGAPDQWRGLRHGAEFRERSSAAVWFSGGRALGVIVDPLPGDIVPGGAVPSDFSGEVRSMSGRVYRDDEVAAPAWRSDEPQPGGVLRMRVIMPDQLAPDGEPLYSAGALYGSDIVFMRQTSRGVAFVFEKYGAGPVESAPVPLAGREHVIELLLPSFQPEKFGFDAIGDVIVRVDGREVMRTRQVCYAFPAGSEQIGRNPFGTTCAPEFRGWILEAKWVKEPVAGSPSTRPWPDDVVAP
ncbi:MAG: hypothetical protein Q7S40_21530 [Opitutaceae bacterium]|nr:hypothetical protein [Opitutaceae bacterium]